MQIKKNKQISKHIREREKGKNGRFSVVVTQTNIFVIFPKFEEFASKEKSFNLFLKYFVNRNFCTRCDFMIC